MNEGLLRWVDEDGNFTADPHDINVLRAALRPSERRRPAVSVVAELRSINENLEMLWSESQGCFMVIEYFANSHRQEAVIVLRCADGEGGTPWAENDPRIAENLDSRQNESPGQLVRRYRDHLREVEAQNQKRWDGINHECARLVADALKTRSCRGHATRNSYRVSGAAGR